MKTSTFSNSASIYPTGLKFCFGQGHVMTCLPTEIGDGVSVNKKVDRISPNIANRDFSD